MIALLVITVIISINIATADDASSSGELSGTLGSLTSEYISNGEENTLTGGDKTASANDTPTFIEDNKIEFLTEFKEFLNSNVDYKRTNGIPTSSEEMIVVGSYKNNYVKLGLPEEARINQADKRLDTAQVLFESSEDLKVEVASVLGSGTRIITIITDAGAPTTYTYDLNLPEGIHVRAKEGNGNALLISNHETENEVAVGYIAKFLAKDTTIAMT